MLQEPEEMFVRQLPLKSLPPENINNHLILVVPNAHAIV